MPAPTLRALRLSQHCIRSLVGECGRLSCSTRRRKYPRKVVVELLHQPLLRAEVGGEPQLSNPEIAQPLRIKVGAPLALGVLGVIAFACATSLREPAPAT